MQREFDGDTFQPWQWECCVFQWGQVEGKEEEERRCFTLEHPLKTSKRWLGTQKGGRCELGAEPEVMGWQLVTSERTVLQGETPGQQEL